MDILWVDGFVSRRCFACRATKILRTADIQTHCLDITRDGFRRRRFPWPAQKMEEHILAKFLRTPAGLSALFIIACGGRCTHAQDFSKLKIGFAIEAMKGERWQTDLDSFEARAKKLGAEVISADAGGNDDRQFQQ